MSVAFFKKVFEQSKVHGGWTNRPEKHSLSICVLGGIYVGVWHFGPQGRVRWNVDLDPIIADRPRTRGLHQWRVQQIQNRLQPFNNATPNQRYHDPLRLHILQEISGQNVLQMIQEDPRRIQRVREFVFPPTLNDRVRGVRTLVSTWSHIQVLRKLMPNVHPRNRMHIPSLSHLTDFRRRWNFLPEMQHCKDIQQMMGSYRNLLSLQAERSLVRWANHNTDWIQRNEYYTAPQSARLQTVLDAMHMVEYQLLQYPGGELPRRTAILWQNIQDRDWNQALRNHDRAARAHRLEQVRMQQEAYERRAVADAERARRNAKVQALYKTMQMLPGMRFLETHEDYLQESALMNNCVSSYHGCEYGVWHIDLDGEPCCLGMHADGSIFQAEGDQHLGYMDRKPLSGEMNQYIKQFIDLNKSRWVVKTV